MKNINLFYRKTSVQVHIFVFNGSSIITATQNFDRKLIDMRQDECKISGHVVDHRPVVTAYIGEPNRVARSL